MTEFAAKDLVGVWIVNRGNRLVPREAKHICNYCHKPRENNNSHHRINRKGHRHEVNESMDSYQ